MHQQYYNLRSRPGLLERLKRDAAAIKFKDERAEAEEILRQIEAQPGTGAARNDIALHELGHAVGVPKSYHYKQDANGKRVEDWDKLYAYQSAIVENCLRSKAAMQPDHSEPVEIHLAQIPRFLFCLA